MGGILAPEVVLCCVRELDKPEPVSMPENELTVHIPPQQTDLEVQAEIIPSLSSFWSECFITATESGEQPFTEKQRDLL